MLASIPISMLIKEEFALNKMKTLIAKLVEANKADYA